MKKLVIAVDFDGTLVESKWPLIGDAMPNAILSMKRLHNRGHKLIIWTCRTGKQLEECKTWLNHWHIPYDAINENLPERVKAFNGDTRKVSADVYVDDKAIGMTHLNKHNFWSYVMREISKLE